MYVLLCRTQIKQSDHLKLSSGESEGGEGAHNPPKEWEAVAAGLNHPTKVAPINSTSTGYNTLMHLPPDIIIKATLSYFEYSIMHFFIHLHLFNNSYFSDEYFTSRHMKGV